MILRFSGKYRWLSNFVGGVEQQYQAAKCASPGDAARILAMPPGGAKRAGRLVRVVDGWDAMKLATMERLVREKFSLH